MQKLLRLAGHNVSTQGTCYCPFHDDQNHRSAKLYADGKVEHLFCFTERRTYRPADVLINLLRKPLQPYFQKIWDSLPDIEKASMVDQFCSPQERIPESWKQKKEHLMPRWKRGFLTYDQLIDELKRYYDDPSV